MHSTLFRHQWKKLTRSTFFRQGWGVKILLILVALYMLLSFGALGVFMKEILRESHPDAELLTPIFSQGVIFYFLADLAMRFFLQDLTVLSVQHYLMLPVSKKKVIHFLLQSSVFSFFNLLPLLFVVPWAIRVVPDEYEAINVALWTVSFLALILSNHYLAIYLKRVVAVKPVITISFGVLVAGLFLANSFDLIALRPISGAIYSPLASQPILALIPLLFLAVVYQLNFQFLKGMTHLDRWKVKAKEASSMRFSFLEKQGFVGMMIANELKLILRNKRTKVVVYTAAFLGLYGLFFYTQEEFMNSDGLLVFVSIFMTGVFMINYGQFLVSWESSYFDGILTRAYSMEDYYRSKYYLMVFGILIMFILTIPYVYFGMDALYRNIAATLYNIGINTAVLLFASTYNKKPIDLSRGSAFNYQGTGAAQFVIVIPLMLVPMLIYLGFSVLGFPYYGLIALGGLGVIGMFATNYFIKQTVINFKEKKYINAAGYRQKD